MTNEETPPPTDGTTLPCDFCGDPVPEDWTTSYCSEECLHYDANSYGNPSPFAQ